jgi:hypothetical protein
MPTEGRPENTGPAETEPETVPMPHQTDADISTR